MAGNIFDGMTGATINQGLLDRKKRQLAQAQALLDNDSNLMESRHALARGIMDETLLANPGMVTDGLMLGPGEAEAIELSNARADSIFQASGERDFSGLAGDINASHNEIGKLKREIEFLRKQLGQ